MWGAHSASSQGAGRVRGASQAPSRLLGVAVVVWQVAVRQAMRGASSVSCLRVARVVVDAIIDVPRRSQAQAPAAPGAARR